MNKTLIKNFAIYARIRLIQMAIDNAGLVGVTKDKITEPVQKGSDFEIYKTAAGTDYTITGNKIKQRRNLVERIKKIGFEQVMEMTAYTWFNRIIAIRFMEVNGYLPTRVRVLSSETAGKKEPDIITFAPDNIDLNLTESEKQQIRDLKAKQKMDEVFQFLFIKQCNELNKYLPKLFEKTFDGELDFTELLFSLSFIQTDGVVARLLEIDEEDFKDQVQIVGWMYQYYNTELKDDTFAKLKKNVKITKERIPAATQLFTPDWIVRYMVENSLGRLYAQNQNAMDEKTVAQTMGWKYYLPQAEQTEDVQKQLDTIKQEQQKNGEFNLETIKVLDPCMGSGHILVYAFDLFIQMYKNAGYTERDAALKIMQNNIFGLDIDDRAAQLAYFALMMKGRQYDRRFFERGIEPGVYAIQESNDIDREFLKKYLCTDSMAGVDYIVETFYDAKEYGSIIDVESIYYDGIIEGLEEWKVANEGNLGILAVKQCIDEELIPLCHIAKIMSAKYDVVVTNPPYMGASGMGERLSNFVKNNYPDSKSDLFAVFIEKCGGYAKKSGLISMITQHAWMFLSSYEKLRAKLNNRTTLNMAHLGARAFDEIGGEVVQTTSFVTLNDSIAYYKGIYKRLVDFAGEAEKEAAFADGNNTYTAQQENFTKIPGMSVAYWVNEKYIRGYQNGHLITDYIETFQGIITGDNDKFLRYWHEIISVKIPFKKNEISSVNLENQYWIPYNKGGEFRKWYGIQDFVVFWKNGSKDKTRGKEQFSNFYLKPYVAWSYTVSNSIAARYYPAGFLWDVRGSGLFKKNESENYLKYLEGLLCSKVAWEFFRITASVLSCQVENILQLPIILPEDDSQLATTSSIIEQNISLSKSDWDSFETSWDFKKHPLV